jgi:hypothetical protein
MAIIVSRTYKFRSEIVPQMLAPPHYTLFSEQDRTTLLGLVKRLDASRERSGFVPLPSQPFMGQNFAVHVQASMVEVQSSPRESAKVVNGFYKLLREHSVPPVWYTSLGEVVAELGISTNEDFHLAIKYASDLIGFASLRGTPDTMHWKKLRKDGVTEYMPF